MKKSKMDKNYDGEKHWSWGKTYDGDGKLFSTWYVKTKKQINQELIIVSIYSIVYLWITTCVLFTLIQLGMNWILAIPVTLIITFISIIISHKYMELKW